MYSEQVVIRLTTPSLAAGKCVDNPYGDPSVVTKHLLSPHAHSTLHKTILACGFAPRVFASMLSMLAFRACVRGRVESCGRCGGDERRRRAAVRCKLNYLFDWWESNGKSRHNAADAAEEDAHDFAHIRRAESGLCVRVCVCLGMDVMCRL